MIELVVISVLVFVVLTLCIVLYIYRNKCLDCRINLNKAEKDNVDLLKWNRGLEAKLSLLNEIQEDIKANKLKLKASKELVIELRDKITIHVKKKEEWKKKAQSLALKVDKNTAINRKVSKSE